MIVLVLYELTMWRIYIQYFKRNSEQHYYRKKIIWRLIIHLSLEQTVLRFTNLLLVQCSSLFVGKFNNQSAVMTMSKFLSAIEKDNLQEWGESIYIFGSSHTFKSDSELMNLTTWMYCPSRTMIGVILSIEGTKKIYLMIHLQHYEILWLLLTDITRSKIHPQL